MRNDIACGQHRTDYVTFRYDPRTRGWVFASKIYTESFPLDGKPDSVRTTRADARKPVSLARWKRQE